MSNGHIEEPIWERTGHRRRLIAWNKARSGAAKTLGKPPLPGEVEERPGKPPQPKLPEPLYTIPEDAVSNWRRIVAEVVQHYGLTLEEVRKVKDRSPHAIQCSQEIAYRLRTFGRTFGHPMSAAEIGKILNRDHSTVLHSVKVHAARLAAAQPQFGGGDSDE